MSTPHSPTAGAKPPFWRVKPLADMTPAEWESLCDGCGRCCLQKFENKKTGRVYFTRVACFLLDLETGRCKAYHERTRMVPSCLVLNAAMVPKLRWLPESCAYRRLAAGQDLKWWHPLVSGDLATVRQVGISVHGKVLSEEYVHPDDLEYYIVKGWR